MGNFSLHSHYERSRIRRFVFAVELAVEIVENLVEYYSVLAVDNSADTDKDCKPDMDCNNCCTKCIILVGKAVFRFGTGGKNSHRRRRLALVGF